MTSMLPAIPAAFGNLKDVFRSAEASVLGGSNAFALPSVSSAIVIMVDGLGAINLEQNQKSAPYLNSASQAAEVFSGFPSTTAVSLASFATGKESSEHGLFGYRIFNRSSSESVNLLSGLDKYSILDYLLCEPISNTSALDVHVVTLAEYENSGMTRATMHGALHHFADTAAKRIELATQVAATERRLIYVYVPELDQAAHRYGVDSNQWRSLLSDLDKAVARMSATLPEGVGVLLTADHGILDVASSNHIYLDLVSELENQLLDVGGDPRVAYLYLRHPQKIESLKQAIEDYCGNEVAVATPAELVAANLWKASLLQEADLLPELVVIALKDVALYHRDFAKATSLKMVGQHGALSATEITVPLLKFGAY